jgi:hypothetical protein
VSPDVFYLISKDLFYDVFAQKYTYNNKNEAATTPTENTTYEAAKNQGITRWWVDVH